MTQAKVSSARQRDVQRLPRRRRPDDDHRRLDDARAGRLEELGEALGLRRRPRDHDRATLQRPLGRAARSDRGLRGHDVRLEELDPRLERGDVGRAPARAACSARPRPSCERLRRWSRSHWPAGSGGHLRWPRCPSGARRPAPGARARPSACCRRRPGARDRRARPARTGAWPDRRARPDDRASCDRRRVPRAPGSPARPRGRRRPDRGARGAAGVRPRRSRPAAASTIASKPPASSLRSRVSTLPRIGWTSRSGRTDRTHRAPPRARGPHHRAGRQRGQRRRAAGHEDVARVGPRRIGAQREPLGLLRRQILEAVHREIDLLAEQRLLDLAHEQSLAADDGQPRLGLSIALGPHRARSRPRRRRPSGGRPPRGPGPAPARSRACPGGSRAPSQAEQLVDELQHRAADARARGLAELGDRRVQDLVHDGGGQRLDARPAAPARRRAAGPASASPRRAGSPPAGRAATRWWESPRRRPAAPGTCRPRARRAPRPAGPRARARAGWRRPPA